MIARGYAEVDLVYSYTGAPYFSAMASARLGEPSQRPVMVEC